MKRRRNPDAGLGSVRESEFRHTKVEPLGTRGFSILAAPDPAPTSLEEGRYPPSEPEAAFRELTPGTAGNLSR